MPLNNIGLAVLTMFCMVVVTLVAQAIMFGAFNFLNKGIDDVKLLRGYNKPDGTKVLPSQAFRLYRALLVLAQLIPGAALAYVPWGWKSGNWTPVLVWVLCGNLAVVVVLLLLRFGALERFILRNTNNLQEITKEEKPNWCLVIVESTALVAMGIVLAGILGGEAPNLRDGILSSLLFAGLCLVAMTAWISWRLRQKKHTFGGVAKQSLSDGIRNNNYLAAARAAGQVLFIGVLLFGAVKGDFTTWSDSIRSSSITLVVSLAVAMLLNLLLDKFLLHLEQKADLNSKTDAEVKEHERWMIVYTVVSSLVLAGVALLATGVVTGAIATVS